MSNENGQLIPDYSIKDYCEKHYMFEKDQESVRDCLLSLSVPENVVDYFLENHFDDVLNIIGSCNNLLITTGSEILKQSI